MPRRPSRRSFLAGLGAAGLASAVRAETLLDASDFGLVADSFGDQSEQLQAAINAAHDRGLPLFVPGGQFTVRNLDLPARVHMIGVPGATVLLTIGAGPVARASLALDLSIEGITFAGPPGEAATPEFGLLEVDGASSVRIVDCGFLFARSVGLLLTHSIATVEDCDFEDCADTGVVSLNGRGVEVSGCRIRRSGNAGIRIWQDEPTDDGSRIRGNFISDIRANGGGNGQNGNGINIFRADGVIVADNHIAGCAFTAVRLNTTRNAQVRGNTCLRSGEVAIFSEFGFSGSVIADNVVDGAAAGISITNFDQDGHLATCSGNVVRNIAPRSEVNPDTTPFGIFAEADAAISGNVVEAVPGLGIGAGWGPYLRNVAITGNVVRDVEIGIGVSVADGAGKAAVSGNIVDGARRASIAGLAWTEVVSDDLVRDAARYPSVMLSGNSTGG